MSRIAIITGSTRPGRHSEAVAKWVLDHAQRRDDAPFDLVDIADYGLAQLDEMMPASMGAYSQPHTHRWADTIASYDGFIFVTPEYNHSTSGAPKNAIDFLYAEWNNKAAGFVSYGAAGGTRAVEHLRLIMAEPIPPAMLRIANADMRRILGMGVSLSGGNGHLRAYSQRYALSTGHHRLPRSGPCSGSREARRACLQDRHHHRR